jgi:hypothetical protein
VCQRGVDAMRVVDVSTVPARVVGVDAVSTRV